MKTKITMETTTKELDIDFLKSIIKMDTLELYRFARRELEYHYGYVDYDKGANSFLYAHGEDQILLVAHLDTVHEDMYFSTKDNIAKPYFDWGEEYYGYTEPEPKRVYHDREEGVLWSPDGLGADDRVGVFMILSLIRAGWRPSVLFTTDEEIGSQSGLKFTLKYEQIADKLGFNYIIELDRSGADDCVFYQCDNKKFTKYVESFGFKTARGTFTDISHICPTFGIAGVNLSVGYYYEHTTAEMVILEEMAESYFKVTKMLKASSLLTKPYKYIPAKKYYFGKTRTATAVPSIPKYTCLLCDTEIKDYLYAPEIGQICQNCYELYYNTSLKDY